MSNIDQKNVEEESWYYRIGKTAGEIYKIWTSPGMGVVRQTLKVIKAIDTIKYLQAHKQLGGLDNYSDQDIMSLLRGISMQKTNAGIKVVMPGAQLTFDSNAKNGEINIQSPTGSQLMQVDSLDSLAPNALRGLNGNHGQSLLLLKKDRIEGKDVLISFNPASNHDQHDIFMEYLINTGLLKPIPKPEYIRIASLIAVNLPPNEKVYIEKNIKQFVAYILFYLNYWEFLGNPESFGISNTVLENMSISDKFLADHIHKRR